MELTDLRHRVSRETRTLASPPLAEDIDDALNMIQRQMIQPIARVETTSTYITTENDGLELLLITDLDTLLFVTDETNGPPGHEITMLNQDDPETKGVRVYADTLFLQRIGIGVTLRFHYYRRLRDLGTGANQVQTPDFAPEWHDLLWMGAASYLNPANVQLVGFFRDRLEAFRGVRRKAGRSGKRFARAVMPWE